MVRLSRRKDRFSTPRALATDDARPTRYGQTLTATPRRRRPPRQTRNGQCGMRMRGPSMARMAITPSSFSWAWRAGAPRRPRWRNMIRVSSTIYTPTCVGFLSHRPHHPTTTVFAGQMRHRLETKVAPWRPRDQHGSWVMLCDTGMHARAPFAALLSTGLPLRSPIARNPNLEPLTQLSPRRTGSRRLAALRAR